MTFQKIERYQQASGRTVAELIIALNLLPGDAIVLEFEETESRNLSESYADYIIHAEKEVGA